MPSVSVTDGSNKIFIIFPKLMLDTNESMLIFLSSFDRKIIPENRNKYKPFHITYKEVMQLKHINIVIIDGVERDMATLSAEERVKIVNELNRVAVGYLGYQKEKTA